MPTRTGLFILKLSSKIKKRKSFELSLGGVRQARAVVQRMGDARRPQQQATVAGLPPQEINLISCDPMGHISDIKLIRTDTTLDLSQKAEKGMHCSMSPFLFYSQSSLPASLYSFGVGLKASGHRFQRPTCTRLGHQTIWFRGIPKS
jgi:hypothetical protein